MRYLVMHKNDPKTEAGEKPPMELVQAMGAFIGEYAAQGKFLDGAGLSGSATRIRLTFRGGECKRKAGPYAGEQELPSAILQLRVTTRDEAIGWAERYGKILGDGELELAAVNEPWDIGIMPKPENAPLQFLLVDKADAATEAGGRTTQQKTALSRLATEMTKAGVLVKSIAMRPSREAKRLTFHNHELSVIDGPFAETKELIGGFSLMELSGPDEAIEMTKRYAAILGGTLVIDLRPVDVAS